MYLVHLIRTHFHEFHHQNFNGNYSFSLNGGTGCLVRLDSTKNFYYNRKQKSRKNSEIFNISTKYLYYIYIVSKHPDNINVITELFSWTAAVFASFLLTSFTCVVKHALGGVTSVNKI